MNKWYTQPPPRIPSKILETIIRSLVEAIKLSHLISETLFYS